MVSMSVGYPDFESELAMAMEIEEKSRMDTLKKIMDAETLLEIQRETAGIYIHESVYRYIVELVRKARQHELLERGGSPRATIALVKMARAAAWMDGRSFVVPGDVEEQFPYIMKHRVSLSRSARTQNRTKESILQEISASVRKPALGAEK